MGGVRGGAARLEKDGTLAGSTLTMEVALQRAVRRLHVPVAAAARSASTTPARVLGIGAEVGSLSAGMAADLVVLGDDFEVEGVMAGGEWAGSGRLFHT